MRENARLGFNHGHRSAHLGERCAQLKSDIAATDDDKLSRNLGERERFRGRDHGATERKLRQCDGFRAGRNHDRFGMDHPRAGIRLNLDRLAVAKPGRADHELDARLLQKAGHATVESPDNAVFPGDRLG